MAVLLTGATSLLVAVTGFAVGRISELFAPIIEVGATPLPLFNAAIAFCIVMKRIKKGGGENKVEDQNQLEGEF